MRPGLIGAMAVLLTAGCAHAPGAETASVQSLTIHPVKPVNIKRVGHDMPPGYEVTNVYGVAAPPAVWGLGPNWTADPAHCGALADLGGGHGESPQGVSGSGSGGTIFAVVAAAQVHLDPVLVLDCPQWTMTNGSANVRVHLVAPPQLDGVETLGMASETIAPVEGGGQIVSQATTFTAYLGSYYAFTTLVTDPGSAQPPLPPQLAADLLVKTVTELRR
ncbi:DUF5642 family protein [Mycobacterium shimoidei]|uniref:DUF5642 domain-containing protein n=1 Tax=Mycobacterium shimoidei TaxID=29313 RepID=A0A1E3TI12_MYCSH|nr:DUF5642 family protein [Mycobacterium shimoidei]MCV7259251.1 DUF5642 family protein [Mycobacterium shimoidei]ODR13309.1 hypothetical protein BHQ16_11225 [Mycobacterium shimoidei]ORW79647.1 hypothetical protein AWC26_14630 [Mycobacterium shimoidei]SRX93889.1 hypothetical protein MSP7336_02134 [Mycobacterium shimoidei]